MADLLHIGTKRHSGRYPWGSGKKNAYLKREFPVLAAISRMAAQGLTEKEIADGLNMTIRELRNQNSLETGKWKEMVRHDVERRKNAGMSISAIANEMNLPKSTVSDLLKPQANQKYRIVRELADRLKYFIDKKGQYLDVGDGAELYLGISRTKLDNAIQLLKNEGYTTHDVYQEQLGTSGDKKTRIKVLAGPDVEYKEVLANRTNIKIPNAKVLDNQETILLPDAPIPVSSNRVLVKYKDDGGGEKDGLIELRRGVDEFSLGGKAYAQVRIAVDDSHFMKGMAVQTDDIPDGYDIVYNTSKTNTGNKLDAMKPQKEMLKGEASVFGAVVVPNTYLDKNGKTVTGPINIVGDKGSMSVEGSWSDWNNRLASQVLSKQSHIMAKRQLEVMAGNYKAELDEIKSITNPTVRQHLLLEYGDKIDKAAVDLKAASLPRQSTNVLLPDPGLKENHIYAPNYNDGEVVSLVRYPHGGIFEIPTLTVNNKYSKYRDIIGTDPVDAVAIHPKVAEKLSGADFDGDFVLCIPNRNKELRTAPSLEGLKNFDPKTEYKLPPGKEPITEPAMQREMGNVSNLITDMTIRGANQSEIARAVRHSMVVIDSHKHELDWQQSYIDNNIAALKRDYQGSARSGASTLISAAKSQERVPIRLDRYNIDPETGQKIYTYTHKTYMDKNGNLRERTIKSTKMGEAQTPEQVRKLSSGTPIEEVYAQHAIKLKGYANEARLASLKTKPIEYSKSARKTYQAEVDSLDAKLKAAMLARPMERQAQIIGGEIYRAKVDAATERMSYSDKQKARGRSIQAARNRLDSAKPVIEITPREWQAIEMGAITSTRLKSILRNADMDVVRSYATPKAANTPLSGAKLNRVKALKRSGYTTAQIAQALGVSANVIRNLKDLE